jgi:hypothetical protein
MDATAGEGALALLLPSQVSCAHKTQVKEIVELKTQLVFVEAPAKTIGGSQNQDLLVCNCSVIVGQDSSLQSYG